MATANQANPLETQPKPECKMKLPKPGCNIYNRIHVKNYRDVLMCGAGVIVGKGRNARAHMHCTIGISVATPETPNKIDAAKLAKELGVDMVLVNRGRILTIDEMEIQGGYIIDFHGVKMTWMAEMVGRIFWNSSRIRTCPPSFSATRSGPGGRGSRCTCCASQTARFG